MDAVINGVLQSLDPYSAHMSPEAFKSMATETSGEFGGLAIELVWRLEYKSNILLIIASLQSWC